jgi:hypothetical protein
MLEAVVARGEIRRPVFTAKIEASVTPARYTTANTGRSSRPDRDKGMPLGDTP